MAQPSQQHQHNGRRNDLRQGARGRDDACRNQQPVRAGGRKRKGAPRPCPELKRHPDGRAFARWHERGKDRFASFGAWGSPEAQRAYRKFALEWAAGMFLTGVIFGGLSAALLALADIATNTELAAEELRIRRPS